MGVHVTPHELGIAARTDAAPAPGGVRARYRGAGWSPRALLMSAAVITLPAISLLWVWQRAVVQLPPPAPLTLFDVPAPEVPEPEPAPELPEPPETTASEPAPAASPVAANAPTAAAPVVPTPAQLPLPAAKAAPAPQPEAAPPPPPPPRAAAAPSQKPADWQARVLGKLNGVKAYPNSARARRQQGVTMIRLTLDRSGAVLGVALAQSSGFALLDREALALPKRASPLPAPPDDVKGSRIELIVPVEFHF